MQSIQNVRYYCENNEVETPAQACTNFKFVQEEEIKSAPKLKEIFKDEEQVAYEEEIDTHLASVQDDIDVIEFLINEEKKLVEQLKKIRLLRGLYIISGNNIQ